MTQEKLLSRTGKSKRSSYLAIVFFLLSPLALTDVSHAAGRVFYDGFEDGTTNKWTPDPPRSMCPVVSASIDGIVGPKAGTKMVRCNYQTDGNWPQLLILGTDSLYNDELFVRMWYRPDTNVNRTGGYQGQASVGIASFKFMRFYQVNPYHDMFEVAGHPQDSNNNAGNPNDNTAFPTYWGSSGDTTNQSSRWHKIEYYIRQSTGSFKVWHDGILIRDNSGYSYAGTKWESFSLQSNGNSATTDNSNHWYVDEFEIYSDKASGATGLMSDATITGGGSSGTIIAPPPAPTNLNVQ